MSETRPWTPAPWLNTLVFGIASAALLIAATFVMFSAFMFYDDEGYVLLSLRNYVEHGALYRSITGCTCLVSR